MRNITYKSLLTKFFTILNLLSLLLGSFVTIAQSQTKRGAAASMQTASKQTGKKCNGGWSGVVTFSKTLKDSLESDEPGIRKAMDRIKHRTSRDYDYSAKAVVDGSANPTQPAVKTTVNFTDNDLSWGQEKVFDTCNSRENGHWFVIEGNNDKMTQAQAAGPARDFNLSVNEMAGYYGFNMSFPDAQGVYKNEEHVKRTGHCQPKNNEPFDRSVDQPEKIKGEGFSISGEKIDPDSPDVLTGTKIWGDDGTGAVRSFIYKVTWRFSKCPGQLVITDLKFEHPKFPNFEDWQEIEDPQGTIDGNKIKVTVTVLNMAGDTKFADLKLAETYKGDKYNYARPDELLPQAESSFRIEGGEEKEFEFIWDSEGQAWFDDSRPHLFHRLKAEVKENGQKKDEKEKPLNIAPKPVILAHGVWSDYRIWEPLYQNLLTESHSYNWKAFPVGKNAREGVLSMGNLGYSDNIFDNADQLARYVKYAQKETNAWHVDMVAHQMGGLVARVYAQKQPVVPDGRPQVKHLVMLGTPNGGAKCIDVFAGKFSLLKDELHIARELTNENMLIFNEHVKNTGGTKFSALAGNPVPVICGGLEWNDGFVTVKSAHYGVSDIGQANDLTHQLVDGKNFGNFVKPHLVTGPHGTYPLTVKNDPTDWKRWQINNRDYDVNNGSGLYQESASSVLFQNVSFERNTQVFEDPQTFKGQVTVAPKQSTEIEVPVEAAQNFGITFMAPDSVTVSLINDKGIVVRKEKAGSDWMGLKFRSFLIDKPVSKGIWKVRIENTSDKEQKFAGYGWSLIEPVKGAPVAE
ncbi:MAG TPA: alpha/beta hydrolase [Pyrinomonadaceae bacterium]|jgi:pimeloyl-ACP methyl ester carboxylesterase|nr:alpha/beta hydrolase [Pyrinomonadaceae bacterium]